jgi:hypothetical protein
MTNGIPGVLVPSLQPAGQVRNLSDLLNLGCKGFTRGVINRGGEGCEGKLVPVAIRPI